MKIKSSSSNSFAGFRNCKFANSIQRKTLNSDKIEMKINEELDGKVMNLYILPAEDIL